MTSIFSTFLGIDGHNPNFCIHYVESRQRRRSDLVYGRLNALGHSDLVYGRPERRRSDLVYGRLNALGAFRPCS